MPITSHRHGLLPPYPSHVKPRLYVDDFLTGVRPGGPAEIDYYSAVPSWPMDMNGPDPSNPPQIPDGIGICGWAGPDHIQMAWNQYAHGSCASWGNDTLLQLYGATGGYVLGDASTDNGTRLQDNLDWWRKEGVNGDRILFFGALRPGSWFRQERVSALRAFGGILYGHSWPESADEQFPDPLTYVPTSPSVGGHCTAQLGELTGMNEVRDACWGKIVNTSTGFLLHTVQEAWVIGSSDFIEVSGRNPSGIDLQGMNDALAQLTGTSNPLGIRRIL